MKKIIIITTVIFVSIVCLILYFKPWMPKCKVWRPITGYVNLCRELNEVRNCAVCRCNGTQSKLVKTNFVLQDINNSAFTFSSNQTISMVQQNQIITQANLWANANAPAGYMVCGITFIPNIITAIGVTYAGIDIKVNYLKCTGNNSLPN